MECIYVHSLQPQMNGVLAYCYYIINPTHALVSVQAYSCPLCKESFCIDCDLFIHETLHNCPGCTSHPNQPQAVAI